MADARARGWGWPGDPGSAQERIYIHEHIITITLNCGVKLRVRREVGHLFKGFFDELERETGYSLADRGQPDDWGFANRQNRNNPNVKSNHAWGLAVDGNAEENPNTHDGRVHTNMPVPIVRRLANKWGLRWGGDYTGTTKDPMHLEFVGTPADVARYPLGGGPIEQPKPQEEDDEMKPYLIRKAGGAVCMVQADAMWWVADPATAAKFEAKFGPPIDIDAQTFEQMAIALNAPDATRAA